MVDRHLNIVRRLLVCPVCKGELDHSPNLIRCSPCGIHFPQASNGYFDLLPHQLLDDNGGQWENRQQEMEAWYKALIVTPAHASDLLINDYTPYVPYLATLSGLVLDIGGGVGIVRHYVPDDTEYVVIDPSLDWLDIKWTALVERFPCLGKRPCFVRGIGEYLPFPSQAFDAALALWSLNHSKVPKMVLAEAHRVLKPKGRLIVILEDMEPYWPDIITLPFRAGGLSMAARAIKTKARCYVKGEKWPVQSDHTRIDERQIRMWISQKFKVTRRIWKKYLSYEFQKI